jgi:4-hydroxythreonine-4-phosphate dehydrogenase
MNGRIGISIGDVTGIGPEVTLKAMAQEGRQAARRFLLIGDFAHLAGLDKKLGLDLPLREWNGQDEESAGLPVFNPLPEALPSILPPGAAPAALASVEWVREAARRCLRGELSAMVTAPVNKEAIVRAGVTFVGQTELLSELAGTDQTAMMLLGSDEHARWLRVVLATTHVPIKLLSERLTQDKILLAMQMADLACRQLRLARARIAVCGLNPHAGEGGAMGTEEITTIGPAVQKARQQGLNVEGPLSADALFYYVLRGDYDVVVAMYHDQGLVPLKMIGFETGVNWTLGLPFIRTSPDHGTAYNIAGQNKASPASMLSAIRLARQLAGAAKSG